VAARVVYTAFGEPIYSEPPAQAGGPTRYLYAGAWGYENLNDAAFPYLHVGERWYDPATGRFLQRDPIGLFGGLNVYRYVRNNPVAIVDPSGLIIWGDLAHGVWLGAKGTAKTAIGTCLAVVGYGLAPQSVGLSAGVGLVGAGYATTGVFDVGRGIQEIVDAIQDRPRKPIAPLPVEIGRAVGGPTGATIGQVIDLCSPPPTNAADLALWAAEIADYVLNN
jgi:RHS repeat-associated protein